MNVNVIEQLTALSLLVDFLFGITFGVVGGAVIGSRRGALLWPASDGPVSAGARVIYGVWTRGYLEGLLPADDHAHDPRDGGESQGGEVDR